ncbi:GMC oxidoreductase, partial [Karstenula rhodostoma CBS 690.94]
VVIGDGKYIAITALYILLLSRGADTLLSSNSYDTPVCEPEFMSTESYRFILRIAIRKTLTLVPTSPFVDVLAGETPPANSKFLALTKESSNQDIDERVEEHMHTIAHPMETCALGDVLDSELWVRGVKGGNLRVCPCKCITRAAGWNALMYYLYASGTLC